jgi:tRNA modification GTPase
MALYNLDDTIAAIATPVGESGIGIVRISGKNALKIANKIFLSKGRGKPSSFKTYTTHYGWIVASHKPQATSHKHEACSLQQEIIDEVILTVMRQPHSYTKEDVVEINCHGGIVALRKTLELVLENGTRIASPGEFTRRAFLNGRIDLTQAEAVLDIIRAKTDSALKIGQEQLKGGLSKEINNIRKVLLETLSLFEANIDFPEEEIGAFDLKDIAKELNKINNELKNIINGSKHGRILREGIRVVICGKPNVGKSSLLNALLRQERSIVTPVAGTTRDTIEEIMDIKGVPVRIVDTAGILEPRDLIEKKAVFRSKKQIDSADLAILLFDGTKKISREDEFLMDKLKKKTIVAAINKIDLKQKIDRGKIIQRFDNTIDISAKKSKNINLLEDAIANLVYNGKVSAAEPTTVTNIRHILNLKEAQKLVAGSLSSLDNKISLELIAQDIKEALGCLDDILGKRFSQDLLNKIFNDFCIGK